MKGLIFVNDKTNIKKYNDDKKNYIIKIGEQKI